MFLGQCGIEHLSGFENRQFYSTHVVHQNKNLQVINKFNKSHHLLQKGAGGCMAVGRLFGRWSLYPVLQSEALNHSSHVDILSRHLFLLTEA